MIDLNETGCISVSYFVLSWYQERPREEQVVVLVSYLFYEKYCNRDVLESWFHECVVLEGLRLT